MTLEWSNKRKIPPVKVGYILIGLYFIIIILTLLYYGGLRLKIEDIPIIPLNPIGIVFLLWTAITTIYLIRHWIKEKDKI